jgi:hypothetical protein
MLPIREIAKSLGNAVFVILLVGVGSGALFGLAWSYVSPAKADDAYNSKYYNAVVEQRLLIKQQADALDRIARTLERMEVGCR